MFISKKVVLSAPIVSLLVYSSLIQAETKNQIAVENNNKSFLSLSLLYAKPTSDNLKYATFVSGIQPYFQSWHYLAIDPRYHPSFELGLNYAIPCTNYSTSVFWTHLNSSDSASKQASTSTDLTTVEFVAPPFEMSPPVFGIKHVASKAKFNFDNILLNASTLVDYNPYLQFRFFGGLGIINLHQTVDTTFDDYAGSPGTPYSYPLPPDPSFSFELKNTSKYLGVGPDLGMNVQFEMQSGFGLSGQLLGIVTVGTIKTRDNFTSTSARLTELNIGTSHQEITAPNATQVVFGADGKLAVFYHYSGFQASDLKIEAGYRVATYLNAISMINPQTLVQPGTVIITPEFSTGTMAIVSTDARSRPFSFNGPFLDVTISLN